MEDNFLTKEYFRVQKEYSLKYGEKTVVMMQKGKFYEIYGFVDESGVEHGLAIDLSDEFGLKLAYTNSNFKVTMKDPYMVGFPCPAYDLKWKELFIQHGYTIVRMDEQPQGPTDKLIPRKVVEVVSPGTFVDSLTLLNNILCIYIEVTKVEKKYIGTILSSQKSLEELSLIAGVSCIDVSTGKNKVCEVYSNESFKASVLQDLYRIILSSSPKEVLVYLKSNVPGLFAVYKPFIIKTLGLDKISSVIINDFVDINFLKPGYQEQIFKKVFKQSSAYQPLSSLHHGSVSYSLLLQYIYDHNQILLDKLCNPNLKWNDDDKYLKLAYNACIQLHLIPTSQSSIIGKNKRLYGSSQNKSTKNITSLIDVVDYTNTPLGKRYLYKMLTSPFTSVEKIKCYHDLTEEMIDIQQTNNFIGKYLEKFPDIEKLHRKVIFKDIKLQELYQLFQGYIKTVQLFSSIKQSKKGKLQKFVSEVFSGKERKLFNECIKFINENINLEELSKVSSFGDQPFVMDGVNEEIDELKIRYQEKQNNLNKIIDTLVQCISKASKSAKGNNIVVYESGIKSLDDEESGTAPYIYTTKARSKILGTAQSNQKLIVSTGDIDLTSLCGELSFEELKANKSKISSPVISEICSSIDEIRNKVYKFNQEFYQQVLEKLSSLSAMNQSIHRFIAVLDYISSNAKGAIENKYFKPCVLEAESSFVEFKNIRHPLVEKIIDSEYITNDIELKGKGLLLYGLNSSGKTCLTKAIGVNLIMAQAGMYTAGSLTFSPYTRVLTRLTGSDDMLKGISSYGVELSELKSILLEANHRSLVLGDELTRGTETCSGSAISTATIISLVNKKSTFILSSHMHHLPQTNYIKDLIPEKLLIKHLTTSYDEEQGILVYDRKLKEGQGANYYGIEVAKSLGFDKDFIDLSNKIRKEVAQENQFLISPKTSRYNSMLYVDSCSLCSKHTDLETHHIREQKEADAKGFIDHFHKNNIFNLFVLCKSCHNNLHKDNKKIIAQPTSDGYKYMVTKE